ncbi:MAG: DUF2752 domain-containing protein [Lachnospiraceae bacterium]|nr:DUF2752 domain-containing protein [Lachnospiraceae bacterium]
MKRNITIHEMIQRICRDLYRMRPALAILFLYGLVTQLVFHTVCPFAIFTGHPCPACGMTRAVLLFLTGNIRLSFNLHPLAMFWPLFLLYLGYFRYLRDRRAPFVWPITITLCLVTIGCYLYRLIAGTLPVVPGPGILYLVLNAILW